jgi:hypothetical protein
MCLVILMYIFCFFQLVMSSLSVDTCVRSGVSPVGIIISVPAPTAGVKILQCSDLVAHCSCSYLERSSISLAGYLAMRIFFYLFSLLPLLFLGFASHIRTAAIISRLSYRFDPGNSWDPSETPFLNHNRIWTIAAIMFCFTHGLGSIFSLAGDIKMVEFFGTMPALQCPSGNVFSLGNGTTVNPACVCKVLYDPPRGNFRMPEISGFQVKQVYDVAAMLLFFNIVYTIWGVLFVLSVFMRRRKELDQSMIYSQYIKLPSWSAQVKHCKANHHALIDEQTRYEREYDLQSPQTKPAAAVTPQSSAVVPVATQPPRQQKNTIHHHIKPLTLI